MKPAHLLAVVVLLACGPQTHTVGRIPPDAGADAGDELRCQPEKPCEVDGGHCAQPCDAEQSTLTTCTCENGRWTGCETTTVTCGERARCSPPHQCTTEIPDCYYCDVTTRTGILCQCQEASWSCHELGGACR
jgi:hypothetical protein